MRRARARAVFMPFTFGTRQLFFVVVPAFTGSVRVGAGSVTATGTVGVAAWVEKASGRANGAAPTSGAKSP